MATLIATWAVVLVAMTLGAGAVAAGYLLADRALHPTSKEQDQWRR